MRATTSRLHEQSERAAPLLDAQLRASDMPTVIWSRKTCHAAEQLGVLGTIFMQRSCCFYTRVHAPGLSPKFIIGAHRAKQSAGLFS